MAVLTLVKEVLSREEAALIEAGATGQGWTLRADARIKTETDPIGVGPVVFEGKPKTAEGKVSRDGEPRDGLLLFVDEGDAVKALLFLVDPTDLQDTLADFMANHGGSITAMKALRPVV